MTSLNTTNKDLKYQMSFEPTKSDSFIEHCKTSVDFWVLVCVICMILTSLASMSGNFYLKSIYEFSTTEKEVLNFFSVLFCFSGVYIPITVRKFKNLMKKIFKSKS
jgi:hypothetical protein